MAAAAAAAAAEAAAKFFDGVASDMILFIAFFVLFDKMQRVGELGNGTLGITGIASDWY